MVAVAVGDEDGLDGAAGREQRGARDAELLRQTPVIGASTQAAGPLGQAMSPPLESPQPALGVVRRA